MKKFIVTVERVVYFEFPVSAVSSHMARKKAWRMLSNGTDYAYNEVEDPVEEIVAVTEVIEEEIKND
ncbi:hypothetical protein C4565_00710 [Candidatus Parcubacteria bacterium]|nr:MAG: hypothetical protein C4565_00710 [Candidatus Parcubacteria bacterium]